jgi:VanZ family protein
VINRENLEKRQEMRGSIIASATSCPYPHLMNLINNLRPFDMVEHITTLFIDQKYQPSRLRAAFCLYALIIVLGSLPHAREAIGQLASGVILHSLAYSFITLLLFSGIRGNLFKKSLWALVTVALMGALDECVQGLFTYRTAAVGDWLVDCAAGLITVLLLFMIWPVSRQPT